MDFHNYGSCKFGQIQTTVIQLRLHITCWIPYEGIFMECEANITENGNHKAILAQHTTHR